MNVFTIKIIITIIYIKISLS